MTAYKKGDIINITVPLPPFLHGEYGESFNVDAVYEGLVSDEEVVARSDNGELKIIYNCLDNTDHHMIYWDEQYWINDLIEYSNEEIKFEPIV